MERNDIIQTTEQWTIAVRSDIAVICMDAEYAEMGNPHGEVYGEVFYLRATNAYGDTMEWGSWETPEAAEEAIADAPPVETWTCGPVLYGSAAWQAYGENQEVMRESEEPWR